MSHADPCPETRLHLGLQQGCMLGRGHLRPHAWPAIGEEEYRALRERVEEMAKALDTLLYRIASCEVAIRSATEARDFNHLKDAAEAGVRALDAYRGSAGGSEAMTFAFCETVTAGPTTPWHIRDLGPGGVLYLSGIPLGGVAICGRKVAWDLSVEITEHHLSHACRQCVEAFRRGRG